MPLKSDYQARIHRVVDHIERHLAENMNLEELARVAAFSPYHFHRVFAAMTGETLHRFVTRLRLERAATHLLLYPDHSVTEIAYDCGFSSPATFARAFKAHYSISATAWRKMSKTDRKNRKTDRNQRKDRQSDTAYLPGAGEGIDPSRRRTEMTTVKANNVEVKTLDTMTVAYVRHVGPYAGDAELFGRLIGQLCKWAGPREFLTPQAKMLAIYHDNPEVTDEDKLRVSMCLTVPADTKAEGEIGVMEVQGGRCALAGFEIDVDQYGAAWQWLYGSWLPKSGYEPDDRPCYELFKGSPNEHPEGKHVFDICLPVRPA